MQTNEIEQLKIAAQNHKMGALKVFPPVVLLSMLIFLPGCGAPIFHSQEERFAPEPELIEQVKPYLEGWATTSPEQTRAERDEVAAQIDGIVAIYVDGTRTTAKGETIYILVIRLEGWGDWERGYFYIHDGSELSETRRLQLRRVDDHFYIFNRNI